MLMQPDMSLMSDLGAKATEALVVALPDARSHSKEAPEPPSANEGAQPVTGVQQLKEHVAQQNMEWNSDANV